MQLNLSSLWDRWVFVNALAEMVGLGSTFAVMGFVISKINSPQSTTGILVTFLITVLCGSIEATIVGLSQWWAMRPWFPQLGRLAWWRATLIGALLGYVLGYLPSTLMGMAEISGSAPAGEPPQWLMLLLAAGLGTVAGAVLSFAQYLVLRGKVERARLWIPANMLAWAVGMPLIFQAIDWAFRMPALWQSVLLMAVGLLIAGAVVGVIHGRALVSLAGSYAANQEVLI